MRAKRTVEFVADWNPITLAQFLIALYQNKEALDRCMKEPVKQGDRITITITPKAVGK